MTSRSRVLLMLAAAGIAFATATGALAAGMYKWTDEKGIVHYSDQMPSDAVNKGTTVLDKQGRAVKKIEPAPTGDQLKAKELEDERLKATARQRDEQQRKDMTSAQASRATGSSPTLKVIQLPRPTTGSASPVDGIGRVRIARGWASAVTDRSPA